MVVDSIGSKVYFKGDIVMDVHIPGYNLWHRLDGPAYISEIGIEFYYIEGKRYANFVEYIQSVIKYKKENNV